MPRSSPVFPTLDDSEANRTMMPGPRNDEREITPEVSPPPMFRQSEAFHGASAQGASSHDREYYMSEPSLSEDGASSSNYTPISPLNGGNLQMTNSPSNTSLSSLGSPGAALMKKRMHQQYNSDALTPTGTLVAVHEGGSPFYNGDNKNDKKYEQEPRLNGGDAKEFEKELIITEETKLPDSLSNPESKMQPKSVKLKVVLSNIKENGVETRAKGKDLDAAKTPDSQIYLTAVESSDEGGQDSDDDSGLSYASSSQEEEEPKQGTKKPYHYLNRPLSSSMSEDNPFGSEGPDTDLLLSNTDSGPIDTSSLGDRSPEDRKAHSAAHVLMLTTPPRVTPFLFAEEEEESLTPKRKTSSTLSENGSSKSGSKTPDGVSTEADDEGFPPQRLRLPSAEKRSSSHRRNRSGDDAAATLLTGSADWVGMEQDKLPLPSQRGSLPNNRDSDEDTNNEERKKMEGLDVNGKGGSTRKSQQRRRSLRQRAPASPSDSTARDADLTASEEGISTRFSPRVSEPESLSPMLPGPEMPRRQSFGEVSASTAESQFSWISNRGSSATGTKGELSTDVEASASSTISHFSWISNRGISETIESEEFVQFDPFPSVNDQNIPLTPPARNCPQLQQVHNDIEMQNDLNVDTYQQQHTRIAPSALSATVLPSIQTPLMRSESSRDHRTLTCPVCKTEQRQFFTVASAPYGFEGPAGYLVTFIIIYMVLSLFIFGFAEGWPPLDCVYFSVTTLTTAGLGDYVPTSDSAKIICSIFIYFGMVCIGLLLGSLHASSLDEAAKKQAKENVISNCPVCARKKDNLKPIPIPSGNNHSLISPWQNINRSGSKMRQRNVKFHGHSVGPNETSPLLQPESLPNPPSLTLDETIHATNQNVGPAPGPLPVEARGRQQVIGRGHSQQMTNIFDPGYTSNRKRGGNDAASIELENETISDIDNDDQSSQLSAFSAATHPTEDGDFFKPVTPMKAAKYVILTLKQACANSLFVIAIGSFGFYYIENLAAVDSFYFTMVLFTTVGYGDIVPKTPEGKLFAAVYGMITLAVLLHILSKISMIPLELRKRRIERAVLMQFGDELDDAALEELATGPLVKRLQMSESSSEGLGQCTREMFALAMLVRLGRITEQDVRSTFAAFRRLDRDNDGLLTSKEIIMSAVERKKKEQMISPRERNLLPQPRFMVPTETMPLTGQNASTPMPTYTTSNAHNVRETHRERGLSFESGSASAYSALTYEDGEEYAATLMKPHLSA